MSHRVYAWYSREEWQDMARDLDCDVDHAAALARLNLWAVRCALPQPVAATRELLLAKTAGAGSELAERTEQRNTQGLVAVFASRVLGTRSESAQSRGHRRGGHEDGDPLARSGSPRQNESEPVHLLSRDSSPDCGRSST